MIFIFIIEVMKIMIKATGLDLTEPLKVYIEEKLDSLNRLLRGIDADVVRARVEVARSTRHHRSGNVYHVDINLDLPGKVLRAEEDHDDMRAAIDAVKDKLRREIEKYKGK